MGYRRLLIPALALVLAVASGAIAGPPPVSWEDAGRLAPDRPPRPKPVEPDAPNNGPFRSAVDRPVAPPVAPPTPAPTIYQLADATGKVWTSIDPDWLPRWVAAVDLDAARARARVAAPQYVQAPCVGGACPPRARRP